MIRDRTIITPLNLDWDRPADFQRQTCLELAKNNMVIVYVQHEAYFFLKKKAINFPKLRNVVFYIPKYFIPLRRFRSIELLNRNLSCLIFLLTLKKSKRIFWFFDSDFVWMLKFARQKDTTLYDCVDDGLSYKRKVGFTPFKNEVELVKKVEHFFVNSLALLIRYRKIRIATYLPHAGFDLNIFMKYKAKAIPLQKHKVSAIIGFVGCIDARMDFILLAKIAAHFTNLQIVLCGPIKSSVQEQVSLLKKLPNLECWKAVPRKNIPHIIEQFSVCIIPYKQIPEVYYSFPTKAFEYLYVGKSVVSSQILELNVISNFIKQCRNQKEWLKSTTDLLKDKNTYRNRKQKNELSINHSWRKKLEKISKYINDAVQTK